MKRDEISAAIGKRAVILLPDGEELCVNEELLNSEVVRGYPELSAIIIAEAGRADESSKVLPSIRAMQQLDLIDYEPASDKGHFRFYPKGAIMFDLLRLWAEEIAIEKLGAYSIQTPIIYDWSQPDIRGQAESFHERHYVVLPSGKDNKQFILRFAGDFGLFRIMRDATISYRNLPMRMFEFSPSFRYEQSGELSGLKRLRGFWMPDLHSFCADLSQGISEYKELFYHYTDLANATGVKYVVAFRIVEDFYKEHKEDILEMVKYSNNPVFIELLSDMKHYWVMKHELNTIDNNNGVCQVSTVQLDIKDASLYGINYVDKDGHKKGCTIVHSSIGSIERWIFSLLEDALKKDVPVLPLWISPTQIRILPVKDSNNEEAIKLAEKIRAFKIRVDVDDRSDTLGNKIRNTEKEWVHYAIVFGDKEVSNTELLPVRQRGVGQYVLSLDNLILKIKNETKDMPYRSLPNWVLSKRPAFHG